jgi:ADP-heptose:LPS heptosyltransferase
MGDVAMTVPVVMALTQQYPEVKITVVSRDFYKPLFDNIPNVSFFAFDEKTRHNGKSGIFQLYKDIKKLSPDAFLDLHNVIRTKMLRILLRFSLIKIASIYKGRKAKKELVALSNKKFRQIETVFEKQQKALSKLGFYIDLGNVKPLTNIKLSLDITNKFQIDKTTRLIGIAPFAQYDSKIYPQDLMQIVINELSLNSRNQILLFGGGSAEIEKLNALKNNLDNVIVIAGEISFKQELEIIFNLDLMLSMDSGNAHIAAMYNVPTVTLWGATHPIAGFNPFRQPLINALVSDRAQYPLIPTSIYGNQIVAGYQDAMRTIAPETVVARINKILNKSI